MKMTGMFNVSNVTAAISVCLKAGLPKMCIRDSFIILWAGVNSIIEIITAGFVAAMVIKPLKSLKSDKI